MTLYDQIIAVSPVRETKQDIIDYYRSSFPKWNGKGGGKQALVHALSSITGMKPKNLERRFDPSRINHVPRSKREKDEYMKLGDMLPPKTPQGGYHIKGTIYVKYSDDCVDREVDEVVTGADARDLLSISEDKVAQAIANAYQSGDGDVHFRGPSTCEEPELSVEAL